MTSKWSVALGALILLIVGVVPRRRAADATPGTTSCRRRAGSAAGTGRPWWAGGGIEAEIAAGADFSPRPPVVRLDPAEQQKRFLLPPGYKIEPVLTDPLIEDPVGVTFDGNGRMYVLEMRSYMQDADGSNSRAPISRISRHEDTDGDGKYDKHTVFVDKMVMPRIAFPLGDGVILALETDNRDMYKYTDTDGDGVSDKKELFYAGVGRVTNMEWQPGGLTWAMDNWLYMTYNPFRLRIAADQKVLREETDSNGGQWWSAQDNHGKMWWVDGGGEIGPVNFQAPIAYGAFNVKDNFEPDFQVPWPATGGIADMQGGMRRVRMPDGTLNHFTAASGVEIYRGHRLPADMVGDLFFTEPVGRIVRRAKIVVTDGLTQLRNAYPQSEFLRSTDPLFRPVAITNAPDGTLYLMDMYTGIIQDAQFVGPNSYLRRKVEQLALDKQHNWGRIWRITYEGTTPDRQRPQMYRDTAAQLVKHLEHANGWWRDSAQKELVLRKDKSVVPALTTMARTSAQPAGEDARALDARGPWRARRSARARSDEARGPEDPHPGDPGERIALQGRRQVLCERLSRDAEGRGHGCRHPGDAHDQPPPHPAVCGPDSHDQGRKLHQRRQGNRRSAAETPDVLAGAAAIARRHGRHGSEPVDRGSAHIAPW